jgi:amidase
VTIPNASKVGDLEEEALLWEFKNDLDDYLKSCGGPVKSLQEVIDFNQKNRDKELALFGQELFLQAEARGPLTSRQYTSLVAKLSRMAKTEGIDRTLTDHQLDALVAPTGGIAWVTDYSSGDRFSGSASRPAAIAGYPHITVPSGLISGLPVAISFFGAPRSDARLIRYAWAFEQERKARKAPEYLGSIRK